MRRPWRWALRLSVLALITFAVYWLTACELGLGSPGATCKAAGKLCDHGSECCSGICRCVDMSEYCTRCADP